LLISLNTWPIGLAYTAVGPGETEGIECGNSWIYWVLRKCCWNGHGNAAVQKWTWDYAAHTSSLALPFSDLTLSPQLMISMIMSWCPKSFCTNHWVGPAKVLPIGPRTC